MIEAHDKLVQVRGVFLLSAGGVPRACMALLATLLISGCHVFLYDRTVNPLPANADNEYEVRLQIKKDIRGLLVYSRSAEFVVDNERFRMERVGSSDIWRYLHDAGCADFFRGAFEANYWWLALVIPVPGEKRLPEDGTLFFPISRTPDSILLSDPSNIEVGQTMTIDIAVLDPTGCQIGEPSLSWSSSDSGIAQVDTATGVVTGVSPGSVEITISAGATQSIASLEVFDGGSDTLSLSGPQAGNEYVFLASGQRPNGCEYHNVYVGTNNVPVSNYLASGECATSEVLAFSRLGALKSIRPTSWTDSSGDLIAVSAEPALTPEIHVWIVEGDYSTALQKAEGDVAWLIEEYEGARTGIAPSFVYHDGTGDTVPGNPYQRCLDSSNFINDIGYMPGLLNVYYVTTARQNTGSGVSGLACGARPDDGRIVIVENTAWHTVLAHEIGHTLSLKHVDGIDADGDGVDDFPPWTNVMNTGQNPAIEPTLTEGQSFRMNINTASYINRSGIRTGNTRTCDEDVYSPNCPLVTFNPD